MHPQRRVIIIIPILILVVLGGWYLVARNASSRILGPLTATGTVEATEILIAPELSGRVIEVMVDDGSVVKMHEALFKLDSTLLDAERQRAMRVLESAKAGLKVAETGVEAASASLNLAQASLELAKTQTSQVNENVRAADYKNRSRAWLKDVPYEFTLPVWYFEKSEQVTATEAEVEAAKTALEKERQGFISELEKSGNQPLIKAEARLAQARIAYEVADEVYDRAVAQNNDDGNNNDEIDNTTEEDVNADNKHVDETVFEAAEDALENAADDARSIAKKELEAAQDDYEALLGKVNSKVIRDARASLTIAIERYELSQDKLSQLYTGSNSLQLQAANSTLQQAEASLSQVEIGVTQAKARLEQAQAAVEQAQSEVDLIDVRLGKLTVYAPVNGVIMSRSIEPGEVVQPGSAALSMGDLESLTITVYIPEDRYGEIKLGMKASVKADSFPGKKFEATVIQIADKAEFTPRNVQTEEGRRTTVFAVKLSVTNVNSNLKPGMPVDVTFAN
jgi:HlyD family secretion protein